MEEWERSHIPIHEYTGPAPWEKTLRDEIAIAALMAIISRGDLDAQTNVTPYCQDAYTIADAMLEAREPSAIIARTP